MTDEQFVREMRERVEFFGLDKNDHVIGCPLCMADLPLIPEEPEADEDAEAEGDN